MLKEPNDIFVSNNIIQDNTTSLHKPKNSAFIPFYTQNLSKSSSQIANIYCPLLTNNYKIDDSLNHSQLNQIPNDIMTQTGNITQNIKDKTNNCMSGSTNSNDNPSYDNNIKSKQDLRINQAKDNSKENASIKKRKFSNKFKICHIEFQKTPNEKTISINKLKHKRKYKPDDIRKKIKARFHKSIKNIINENLRKAGSRKLFTYLPQAFISSISREKNQRVFNLSFRELLQKNFVNEEDDKKYKKNRNVDLAKYKKNLSVLEYLDNNPEICQNSGFDIISKMKYCDLLDEYFHSDEFKRAIFKLREENEDEDYIREYIHKSENYVKFFTESVNNKSK